MEQGIISSFKPSAPQSEHLEDCSLLCNSKHRLCCPGGLLTTSSVYKQLVNSKCSILPSRGSELQSLCSHSTSSGPLQGHHYRPQTTAPEPSAARSHRRTPTVNVSLDRRLRPCFSGFVQHFHFKQAATLS